MSILRKFRPYFTRAYLRELFAARSERGPYRFLVSRFERVNSPDLAARILETDLFRTQLTPVRPPVETAGMFTTAFLLSALSLALFAVFDSMLSPITLQQLF